VNIKTGEFCRLSSQSFAAVRTSFLFHTEYKNLGTRC